ncbi:PRA1 family protein G2 [Diospyros lotus]|uniref:PRA1 family protein G2 n=1 Tax=Diospyros lotus TaxID=55363 RepID=UPI0022549037|nr:PRA1 family protein G2 [Diospyros lotus]
MLSPTKPTSSASVSAAYTTIPISVGDVISRSFQNLSNAVSRYRPWQQEFVAAGAFDRPDSLSAAGIRLRRNARYFVINYGIIIAACAAATLLGAPVALMVYAAVFVLWLVLHFFREDPVVVWGHHVDDRLVIGGLALVTVLAVWFTGEVTYLLNGVAVGLLISAIHGALRNPDGLFLDEEDAVFNGLIGTSSASRSYR